VKVPSEGERKTGMVEGGDRSRGETRRGGYGVGKVIRGGERGKTRVVWEGEEGKQSERGHGRSGRSG